MGVRIRLARHGRVHSAFYRLVACDSRSPRSGKHLEILGTYDPHPSKSDGTKELRLNVDRIKYWIGVGARGTRPVDKLLGRFGLLPEGAGDYRSVETAVPKKDREGAKKKFSTMCAIEQVVGGGEYDTTTKTTTQGTTGAAAAAAAQGTMGTSMMARAFAAGMAPWAVVWSAFGTR